MGAANPDSTRKVAGEVISGRAELRSSCRSRKIASEVSVIGDFKNFRPSGNYEFDTFQCRDPPTPLACKAGEIKPPI